MAVKANQLTKPTNAATRDLLSGWITIVVFSLFIAAVIVFPVTWHLCELLFNNTNLDTFQIYKLILSMPITFIHNVMQAPAMAATDIFGRFVFAAVISARLSYYVMRDQINPKSTEIIEKGEDVSSDTSETLRQSKIRMKDAKGIHIHPEIRLPFSRESEHIFVGGSTGAGKSQAMSWMIKDVLERGDDKSITFDVKCDFTSQIISHDPLVRAAQKRFLIAPWDERSIQWNIAQDVLSGVLCYFIKRYKESNKPWGFKDLSIVLADPLKIKSVITKINHAAKQHIQIVDGNPSPQTQGVLGSIRAPLKSLDQLANYWPEAGGVSIVRSFLDDSTKGVHLVLAAKPDMQSVAVPLVSGLMALLMKKGLALPDSKTRRLWFILDELGALPRISALLDAITLGRSKGICLIVGTQDLGRLESVYGREQVQTISSQFGTHLIGRLGDESTASWAAKLFGQQRIERLQISENQAQGYTGGLSYTPAVSTTWQQSDKASLIDSDFLHLPKATGKGFYIWARLTDDEGHSLLGKLKYPINPVPTPFPACIDKFTEEYDDDDAGFGNVEGSKGAPEEPKPEPKPVQENPKPSSDAVNSSSVGHTSKTELGAISLLKSKTEEEEVAEATTQELDALIAISPAQNEQEPEQALDEGNPLETQAAGVLLEAVAGLTGADTVLDAMEALDGDQQVGNSGSQQAISSTKTKKKKKKKKKSLFTGLE